MTLRTATATAATLASLALLPAARNANAQGAPDPSVSAARRELIEQAQREHGAGNHAAALDLAERAGRIAMTPSLRYFIAQEQSDLGRLAEALGNADTCLRESQGATGVRNSAAIASSCSTLAEQLRSRVGRVVVRAPAPAPAGLRVTVAGTDLPEALWGVPYVVTPGNVHVEATAEHAVPFRTDVAVGANTVVEVPLALEPEAPAPAAEAPPAPATETRTVTRINPLPAVPAALGAVGLIAGGVLYGLAAGVSGGCPNATCATDEEAARGNGYATASYVALAAGGVLLAGGVVWFLVAGRRTETETVAVPRASAAVLPAAGGGAQLGIVGSF